jgi:hypothetical protein
VRTVKLIQAASANRRLRYAQQLANYDSETGRYRSDRGF